MVSKQDDIIRIANNYIGIKEFGNNQGFYDAYFEEKLKHIGWLPGQAWCMYLCKLVYREAHSDTEFITEIDKVLSPSVMKTKENASKSKLFQFTTSPDIIGSIGIMQLDGKWKGHAFINCGYDKSTNIITTIEGNTNIAGSREGDTVCQKKRNYKIFSKPHQGLCLTGFIYF